MVKRLARRDWLALSSLACTAMVLFLAFRDLAVDDAFVTYRYAFNLAHQQGYLYNPGAATLSTTAPFYGLVLALFASLGLDIPLVSNTLSALSIAAGGMLLYAIGRRHGRPRLGWIAGMLYVVNPLLWLSLGMETDFLLALVLAAFAADEYGMPGIAGLALGAAFVTRYDAALPAAILFFRRLLYSPRSAIKMACIGLAAAAPVLVFLTVTFGSPLPVTLLAKRAQNLLGVTGFYAGTSFVEGLVILLRGWFEQTWLYALSGAAVVGGLVLAIRGREPIYPSDPPPPLPSLPSSALRGLSTVVDGGAPPPSPSPVSEGGGGWGLSLLPFPLGRRPRVRQREKGPGVRSANASSASATALVLVLWAAAHVVAYIFLGSAPYYWYYAPLVPAAVWLIAIAIDWGPGSWTMSFRGRSLPEKSRHSDDARSLDSAPHSSRGSARDDKRLPISNLSERSGDPALFAGQSLISSRNLQSLISNLLLLFALAPFVYSLAVMWQAQAGPLPDSTTNASKVLPEAKVDVYRRVGEWMAANAASNATLGATEIGVMGYYAQRDVVDFLGLLQRDVATALARGDPSWALFAYQPDYVALDAVNPIYTFDPRGDDWFRAAYLPVQRFDDERFWASPMVVYRRQAPRIDVPTASLSASAAPLDVRFGDSTRLVGIEFASLSLQAGEPLAVRLWWRGVPAEKDYAVSVQLLGQDDLIIAQRESQLTTTAGTTVSQVALLGLPETTCAPDSAQLNIAVYDPKTGARLPVTGANGNNLGDSLRFGRVSVERRGATGNSVDISFGRALTLASFDVTPRSVAAGEVIRLMQTWRAGGKSQEGLSVFVHLLSEDGKIVAQADGPALLTGEDVRDLKVPSDAAAGVYRLSVGVYQREGGKRLPWLDAVGQPLGDSLALCPVRVR